VDGILVRMKSRFRRSASSAPQGSVDGFLGAPVRRQSPAHPDHAMPSQPTPELRARQIGNFQQAEGYHPTDMATPSKAQSGEPTMLNMTLPSEFSAPPQQSPAVKSHRLSWRAIRKWTKRTVLAVVVLAILGGGFLFAKGYSNLHKVFKGSGKTAVALQSNASLADLKTEGDARVNILLLGIGGLGHDGPDLTDTMLIASIDPVNHTTALVSIPRDLWVTIPHRGSMKINAAYETGKYAYLGKQSADNKDTKAIDAGFASADSIVSQVTGVSIQYNVLLNFQAFEQAVNTVGGVTITVPTTLYDPTMAWENGGNPVLAKAGVQTFNGLRALFYVRSRETTSDFARTQRQRAVIVALMQKVFTLGTLSNPIKITQLIDAFGSNVVTDISLGDMSKMYSVLRGIDLNSAQSIGLADPPNNFVTTGRIGTQSVVMPRAGLNNYTAIQAYIRSMLPDGHIVKEAAKVAVLNGTPHSAVLASKVATLKSYGYTIVSSADAPSHDYSKTVVVDLTNGKDPYTAHYLQNRFGVKPVTALPAGVTVSGADFVIILGQDQI